MSDELKYVHLTDWRMAERRGMDAGRRPISPIFNEPLGGVPQPPVPTHFPVAFSLFDRRTRASERRREVNQLLADAGVRPPRRR